MTKSNSSTKQTKLNNNRQTQIKLWPKQPKLFCAGNSKKNTSGLSINTIKIARMNEIFYYIINILNIYYVKFI